MVQIDRHPHSQAFHEEVDALLNLYETECGGYRGAKIESLFGIWEGEISQHGYVLGIKQLCKNGQYLGIAMIADLQVLALTALSILEGLPEHTIGIVELLDHMKSTHDRKQADYGNDYEPFSNLLASQELGVHPVLAICVRMNDKVARIKSFVAKGVLQNESVDDSLLDIAVYAIIAVVLIQETLKEVTQ